MDTIEAGIRTKDPALLATGDKQVVNTREFLEAVNARLGQSLGE